jgi:hypothetical protein
MSHLGVDDNVVEDDVSAGGGDGNHGAVRLPHHQQVLTQLPHRRHRSPVRDDRHAGLAHTEARFYYVYVPLPYINYLIDSCPIS